MALGQEVLSWAKNTLKSEADSLLATAEGLSENFCLAVEYIMQSQGKVVVAGLGKSGHVGRKISATLASTGTSSFFLHPAEALHGDLGMMDERDVLLAIAFGETHETVSVAKAARRNGQRVIVISGKEQSSLAKLADVFLDGGVTKEACPLNLAPTNSTTVAMALGDALAVALMKARGFKEEDFAQFHPGGSLGRKLSLVQEHMRELPLQLNSEDGFDRILEVITSHNYGIAAVVDQDSNLVGAITDGDLRRSLIEKQDSVFQLKAKDFIKTKPKVIPEHTLAVDAVTFMEQYSISTVFVEDSSGKMKGIVRMYDLLAAKIV